MSETEVAADYLAGAGLRSLCQKYKIGSKRLNRILASQQIQRRAPGSFRRYQLDHSFFDNIDTEAKAYFFGLLCADGCVTSNGNSVHIHLHQKDADILEKFAEVACFSGPIKYYRDGTVRLRVHSQAWTKALTRLGCTPRKSFTLKFPGAVPRELTRHFVRGYFDGDGTVYVNRRSQKGAFGLIAPLAFTRRCRDWFHTQGVGVRGRKVVRHARVPRLASISYSRAADLRRGLTLLYDDATYFLNRKRRLFGVIVAALPTI